MNIRSMFLSLSHTKGLGFFYTHILKYPLFLSPPAQFTCSPTRDIGSSSFGVSAEFRIGFIWIAHVCECLPCILVISLAFLSLVLLDMISYKISCYYKLLLKVFPSVQFNTEF